MKRLQNFLTAEWKCAPTSACKQLFSSIFFCKHFHTPLTVLSPHVLVSTFVLTSLISALFCGPALMRSINTTNAENLPPPHILPSLRSIKYCFHRSSPFSVCVITFRGKVLFFLLSFLLPTGNGLKKTNGLQVSHSRSDASPAGQHRCAGCCCRNPGCLGL